MSRTPFWAKYLHKKPRICRNKKRYATLLRGQQQDTLIFIQCSNWSLLYSMFCLFSRTKIIKHINPSPAQPLHYLTLNLLNLLDLLNLLNILNINISFHQATPDLPSQFFRPKETNLSQTKKHCAAPCQPGQSICHSSLLTLNSSNQ